jgi:ribosomal protein S14
MGHGKEEPPCHHATMHQKRKKKTKAELDKKKTKQKRRCFLVGRKSRLLHCFAFSK